MFYQQGDELFPIDERDILVSCMLFCVWYEITKRDNHTAFISPQIAGQLRNDWSSDICFLPLDLNSIGLFYTIRDIPDTIDVDTFVVRIRSPLDIYETHTIKQYVY